MSKDSQTPSVLSMDIILITKPDIEIIVIQEYLLYVCISIINLIVWIYHFVEYIIAIKVKDVVGQEHSFSILKSETPGRSQFQILKKTIIYMSWRYRNYSVIYALINSKIF
jgi:hypothetical protein